MEFLITEKQLIIISENQKKDQVVKNIESLFLFTNDMIEKVLKVYGINLKMFLTWATSVGGFVVPLDNFIKNGNFNVTDDQRMLILSGAVAILFFESSNIIKQIIKIIKKEKIEDVFIKTVNKMSELKKVFESFMMTVKNSTTIFLETIAYSFLIPIITDILEITQNDKNVTETIKLLSERMLASGLILLSREVLINLINNIVKKLKSSQ